MSGCCRCTSSTRGTCTTQESLGTLMYSRCRRARAQTHTHMNLCTDDPTSETHTCTRAKYFKIAHAARSTLRRVSRCASGKLTVRWELQDFGVQEVVMQCGTSTTLPPRARWLDTTRARRVTPSWKACKCRQARSPRLARARSPRPKLHRRWSRLLVLRWVWRCLRQRARFLLVSPRLQPVHRAFLPLRADARLCDGRQYHRLHPRRHHHPPGRLRRHRDATALSFHHPFASSSSSASSSTVSGMAPRRASRSR